MDDGLVCRLWPFQWLLIYKQCCDVTGMGSIIQTRWPNGKSYFEQSAKLESIFSIVRGELDNHIERSKHGH